MFVTTVIPLSRGNGIEELTYYSGVEYSIGSFVHVPIKGKEKEALVVKSEKVVQVKSTVRGSAFTLKKIRRQKGRQLLTRECVHAVISTARLHGGGLGATLYALVPSVLLETEGVSEDVLHAPRPKLRGFIIPRLYQGLAESRIEFYKTSIREAFAAKCSVYIMTPTIADAERVSEELCGGVESYLYTLHSKLSKKEQEVRVKNILDEKHPVVVVGTGGFLSVPRCDLTTIIIEKENSPHFRTRSRPYIDLRVFALELTRELGGQVYLADLPMRIESIYKREIGDYEEIVTGQHRMHFRTRAELVNLQGVKTSTKKPFRAIEDVLFGKIRETNERRGRVFLYVARRGLSPSTLCRDCGTTVVCKECDAPVVLHKGAEENYFLCHSCGSLRHARERCSYCESWRLEMVGIGAELVERELRERLSEAPLFVLSSDTAKTHTQAKKIVADFYTSPQSILIGTEMALPYLTKHIPLVGVVSLDSLLFSASWNMYEKVAVTLTRLREISGEELLVQTRKPETSVLRMALTGNFSAFYKSELRARKKLGYPPYTVIIKISVFGTQEVCKERMEEVKKVLLPYEVVSFSRFLRAPQGKFVLHGFLRVRSEEWPDGDLVSKLQLLGDGCIVTIDPDTIM